MSSVDSPVLPAYLGVDVGGTSIKIGIVDDTGRSLAHGKIATCLLYTSDAADE